MKKYQREKIVLDEIPALQQRKKKLKVFSVERKCNQDRTNEIMKMNSGWLKDFYLRDTKWNVYRKYATELAQAAALRDLQTKSERRIIPHCYYDYRKGG